MNASYHTPITYECVLSHAHELTDKGGKVVTNPESCLLDWPVTDVGKEQVTVGTQALCEIRHPGTLDISYETLHMKINPKKRRIKSMRPSDGWYAGAL